MKTRPGTTRPEQLYRELPPGQTFQVKWHGKLGDYMVTDLARADPDSKQPWDFRAAVNLASGEIVLLPPQEVVSPTDMEAGPA